MSIEAIKQALEELQYVLNSSTNEDFPLHGNSFDKTISILEQAIEQAEKQEPVGEIVQAFEGLTAVSIPVMPPVGTKLYAAPPQREWVGLTDADIAHAMHGNVEGSNMLPYQFARAIEAKLKEKNT